ncbi:MAG: hypothetical protein RL740_705 [Actinomycetota bacterium]|jgi:uncharacterized RDD family membrane protein YckC
MSEDFQVRQVSLGRRMAGITIDWFACYLIINGFDLGGASFSVLILFFLQMTVLTAFGGASFGHRIMGMKVVRFQDGLAPTPLQALIRSALICTVVFAITYDENGRGIHERLSGTHLINS